MHQVLHIFRKDIRHLRWQIAAVIVFVALRTVGEALSTNLPWDISAAAQLREVTPWTLMAAWVLFIATLVQSEPIPGDRSFWLTRPYRRSSLIAAKILAIGVFVVLPFIASDCVILAVRHVPPSSEISALTARYLLIAALLFLPAAALAAVTRSLTEFVTGALAIAALAYVAVIATHYYAPPYHSNLIDWLNSSVLGFLLLAASAAILLLQYRSRRTFAARACIAAAALLAVSLGGLSWDSALALHAAVTRSTAIAPTLALGTRPTPPPANLRNTQPSGDIVFLQVPLTVRGLPANFSVTSPGAIVRIQSPDGDMVAPAAYHGMRIAAGRNAIVVLASDLALQFTLPRDVYNRLSRQPVDIRGAVYLTLIDSTRTFRMQADQPAYIPSYGFCRTGAFPPAAENLQCDVFSWSNISASVKVAGTSSTFPADAVSSLSSGTSLNIFNFASTRPLPPGELVLTLSKPVAELKTELALPDLHLADYVW